MKITIQKLKTIIKEELEKEMNRTSIAGEEEPTELTPEKLATIINANPEEIFKDKTMQIALKNVIKKNPEFINDVEAAQQEKLKEGLKDLDIKKAAASAGVGSVATMPLFFAAAAMGISDTIPGALMMLTPASLSILHSTLTLLGGYESSSDAIHKTKQKGIKP